MHLKPVDKSCVLLIHGCGAAQAAQEGCRHPPPTSFTASYLSPVYYRLLFAGEDSQCPFPCASYSSRSSTSPNPTTPCPPALDLASATEPQCFTHYLVPLSPLLSISSHLSKGFSLICSHSFEHSASCIQPLLLLNKQDEWRTEGNWRTTWAQQEGDTQVWQEIEKRKQSD